jgi:hypothetical protein
MDALGVGSIVAEKAYQTGLGVVGMNMQRRGALERQMRERHTYEVYTKAEMNQLR